jgi:putative tryptophan/tyrosine transport system substrate-binding protein
MNRRAFLSAVSGSLLAAPLAAEAQSRAGKVPRVGILNSDTAQDARVGEFRDGLRELGYVEGQNLLIIYRWADGHQDRLPALADDLLASNVDVIVAIGASVWAAKRQTSTVPIVIAFSGDPVGTAMVSNLARPGGNITGLSFMSSDLAAKRLELLKQTFPRITRVAVLYLPAEVSTVPELRETEAAARMISVTLQPLAVRNPGDLEPLFGAATRERADALLVFAHAFAFVHRAASLNWPRGNACLPCMVGASSLTLGDSCRTARTLIPYFGERQATSIASSRGRSPATSPSSSPRSSSW